MPENPECPVASRTSAVRVWLSLALAAVMLALYTAVALATGGVARADEAGADSGATGAATSQQSDPAGSATGKPSEAESGPPKATVGNRSTVADSDSESESGAPGHRPQREAADPDEDETDTPDVVTEAADPDPAVDADATGQTPADTATTTITTPTESQQPSDEIPTETTEPDIAPVIPLPPADASRGDSNRSGQLATVTALAANAESTPPGPSARGVAPPAAVAPSPDTSAPAPTVSAPAEPLITTPTIRPDIGLQFAGLVADVSTVAVSAVHTAATAVALFFGPDSFLGVPALLATIVANTAAAVGRTIVGAPFIEPTGRFAVTYGILDGLAFFNPTKPPAGANDPSITVTAEHPLPIILLNGTTATQGTNWSVGAPVLANAGYKVYTFNYGNNFVGANTPIQATADIDKSADELATMVQRVLTETGAEKVILIGHSQGGGILPVHYINNKGGAQYVSQLIGLAPSNHGTDFNGLIVLQTLPIFGPLALAFADAIGPALRQQTVDSPFQQEVYGNGDTRPGVLYTNIISVNDEVVTPFTQQALDGPAVTNIVLQERYPGLVVGHANIIVSPQTWALVLDALESNAEANPQQDQETIAA